MDYSKVTMMEYQEKKKAILNSLGRIRGGCIGIKSCNVCPFSDKHGGCKNTLSKEMENSLEMIKIVMDYEIPIDWSSVELDTPILVRNYERENWYKRYFAKYENNTVYAFDQGATSWSNDGGTCKWVFAKLANTESEEQK